MKHILLFFCCLAALPLFAQKGDKADRKAMELFDKAQESMRSMQYDDVLAYLNEALAIRPNFPDAYGQMGMTYTIMKRYPDAVKTFKKLLEIDPDGLKFIRTSYIKALAGMGQFQEALEMLKAYQQTPSYSKGTGDKLLKNLEFAVTTKAVPFQPQNMGDGINTRDAEYFPSPTIDGKTLVFTRRVGGTNEDFFVTGRDSAQPQWQTASDMGEPVNTAYNEGAQNISQDGEMLVYTGCDFPGGRGSCDIYFSVKTPTGWSPPRNIGAAINTDLWESQPCLSPDKQTLYFVRQTSDAGSDIFVSHRGPDGRWSLAERLGAPINTPGRETTPFLHADGQTLYFASDGHPGYGGLDIFYARLQPDGQWGTPVNLGYPINTIDEEGSFTVSADGATGYFASDRTDSKGSLDIYQFELYQSARPLPTLYVRGYVYDVRTNKRLGAALELVDLSSKLTVANIRSNEAGEYLVPLPAGRDYALSVSRPGYLFYSDNFSLKDARPDHPFEKNIPLQPLEANAVVVLRNVFFASKEYTLQPASATELDKLAQLMKDNPSMQVELSGHTDNVGSDADNQLLSENRAKAVVEYLVKKGISAKRMKAAGYGESKPVDNNDTEEGRAQNRRTELKIISL
ncbi:OmpA family protein [Chitinophaga lutea]